MKRTTIAEIVQFMREAVKRTTGAGDLYKYGQRIFLIEDKRTVVEMVRSCLSSQRVIARELALSWDNEAKWLGRFTTWGNAYNKGQLDISRAVAVQRPQPKAQPEPIDSFKLLIEYELRAGKSIQTIVDRAFEVAHAWKVERANDTLVDVEALLKTKGLTIDDLKKVL